MKENRYSLKRVLAVLLSVALILTVPIIPVYATGDVSYISRVWNGSAVTESALTCTQYTSVTSGMSTDWNTGWYVVDSDVTINDRIEISGAVNLILCDGFTLTAPQGIHLTGDDKLSPDDDCLRAQIITFLYRAYNNN